LLYLLRNALGRRAGLRFCSRELVELLDEVQVQCLSSGGPLRWVSLQTASDELFGRRG
jgi:hypothetical protein